MRRPLVFVLGIAATALASCAPLVASFDFGGDEADTFVTSVAAGEPQRAYDLLCPSTRFAIAYEAFRDAVERNAFLLAATGVSINKYESGGGLAVVQKGWLESTGGVTAATFYLSKIDQAWCLTGVEIGGTPVLPAPAAAAPAAAPAADRARLPAPLQNEAFRAYGLSNPATRRYRMTTGDEQYVGTQRADLIEVGPAAARFRILRSGGLATLGSIEVSLRAEGIDLVASSQGRVEDRTLILPAKLDTGATWTSAYAIGPEGAGTHYRGTDVVEGRETVNTPAGAFDAIRIVSNATVESAGTKATVRTTVWYALDVGSVRSESETTVEGGVTTRVVIELIDRGQTRSGS
jgi:hypothetical protein